MNETATTFEVVLSVVAVLTAIVSIIWAAKAQREEDRYTEEEKRRLEQEKLQDSMFRDDYHTTQERPWKAE